MERMAGKFLLDWKNSSGRKPLLLLGARQVGKTWLMQEFGKNEYKNTVYANFEKKKAISRYFEQSLEPSLIIAGLQTEFKTEIRPQETLIIFDEVQESELALNSLKYFCENAPEYHVMAAGSFLGIATHGSFPVGKVNRLTLYPLSFYEFLDALGYKSMSKAVYEKNLPLIQTLSSKFEELLKIYFYVGGMPSAVYSYSIYGDIAKTRKIQKDILEDYETDFFKHISPANVSKVKMIWNSIPVHLAKEKKKFMYKELKEGARAYAYEDAMNWLFDTKIVCKVSQTTSPSLPLSRNAQREAFKLYMVDIGLLCAHSGLKIKTFFEAGTEIFGEFKGALTEQFVLQELRANSDYPVFYWSNESGQAEVDFLLECESEAIPLEVKSGIQTKAKSLNVYMEKYAPNIAIKSSLKNYGKNGNLLSIPLYLIGNIASYLD
jgi:predicted AAA+ superfamily ATPase